VDQGVVQADWCDVVAQRLQGNRVVAESQLELFAVYRFRWLDPRPVADDRRRYRLLYSNSTLPARDISFAGQLLFLPFRIDGGIEALGVLFPPDLIGTRAKIIRVARATRADAATSMSSNSRKSMFIQQSAQ